MFDTWYCSQRGWELKKISRSTSNQQILRTSQDDGDVDERKPFLEFIIICYVESKKIISGGSWLSS